MVDTINVLGPLIVGFLGSFHCLGMCGPLVLAYSVNFSASARESNEWKSGITHHLAFHCGRLLSYGFLGALAAGMVYGAGLVPFFGSFRNIVSVTAGALMLLLGLAVMRLVPLRLSAPAPSSRGTGALVHRLISSARPASKWLLGMGAGFMPCMLPWAMLIKAASTGDMLKGFFIMVLFGLGTVPALLLIGVSASMLSVRTRLFGEHLAGLSIVAMGAILLWKGAKHFIS
ncbi:MAG TPA: sulfite exporter TauE/SafE family protein [Syntrophorhabdales bacterium]|nr:sulfite exporter TauE/SafE family protein [Syntrophorhabdales bacterium]